MYVLKSWLACIVVTYRAEIENSKLSGKRLQNCRSWNGSDSRMSSGGVFGA